MNADTPISPLWATLRRLLRSEGLDADSLSLDKLALALGVGRGTVQRIKEGYSNIRAETMHSLADRFAVSVAAMAAIVADWLDGVNACGAFGLSSPEGPPSPRDQGIGGVHHPSGSRQ